MSEVENLHSSGLRRVAVGADHAGFMLKRAIIDQLSALGHPITDVGCHTTNSVDYPDFAVDVARSITGGYSDIGILICGSGSGMAIAANKVKGIRAVNCFTPEMATLAVKHNNANILCLGARILPDATCIDIAITFLNTEFDKEGRHLSRIEKITQLTEL